jgi:hypothetical protein
VVGIYFYLRKGGNNDELETASNNSVHSDTTPATPSNSIVHSDITAATYAGSPSNSIVHSDTTPATYAGSASNSYILSPAAENIVVEGVTQYADSNLSPRIDMENYYSLESFRGTHKADNLC